MPRYIDIEPFMEELNDMADYADILILDIRERLKEIQTADVVERKNMTRLEKELNGKTPKEQIDFIRWWVYDFSMRYTSSIQAMIQWNTERSEDETN